MKQLSEEQKQILKKKMKLVRSFKWHVMMAVIAVGFMLYLNLQIGGSIWWIYVLPFWGITLGTHYILIYGGIHLGDFGFKDMEKDIYDKLVREMEENE